MLGSVPRGTSAFTGGRFTNYHTSTGMPYVAYCHAVTSPDHFAQAALVNWKQL